MKEPRKTPSELVLVHSKDARGESDALSRHLAGVPTRALCVEDPDFCQNLQDLCRKSVTRLHAVFLSPEFLKFLEQRPEAAFDAFRDISPMTAVAVFCRGLLEREVMCYHMAPLNAFGSWPKFEVMSSDAGVPDFLLQTLEEAFSVGGEERVDVEIVPSMVNKEVNTVYAIFSKRIDEVGSFTIDLEAQKTVHITPSHVNPYVLRFSVPDMLMSKGRTVCVRIRDSEKLIAEKKLSVVWDRSSIASFTRKMSQKRPKTSREELLLEEQLRFLSDFTNSLEEPPQREAPTDEHFNKTNKDEDNITESLTVLCKKYGLDELSFYIAEQDAWKEEQTKVIERNDNIPCGRENERAAERRRSKDGDVPSMVSSRNSLHADNEEDFAVVKRSLSLPSLLTTQEEMESPYAAYLRMGPGGQGKTGFLGDDLESDQCYSALNNGYVYMQWNGVDEPVQQDEEDSQKELLDMMLAFKHGQKSISAVEEQFGSWKRRHGQEDPAPRTPHQGSGWKKNLMRKKSRRKISKEEESCNGRCRIVSESSSKADSRKTSNASATSTSSKGSENSCSTTYSRNADRNFKESVSTGFVPTYSTSAMCPLYPQDRAPPLPPRPPVLSKPKAPADAPGLTSRSRKKSAAKLVRSVSRSQNDLDLMSETARLHALVEFCEQHGLQEIREHFIDLSLASSEPRDLNMELLSDTDTLMNSKQYVHGEDWDPDSGAGTLHRSLSLPSTLYCSIGNRGTSGKSEDSLDPGGFHRCERSSSCKCDDCLLTWGSVDDNIYASLKSQKPTSPSSLQKGPLSSSQQELLELIHAFKRGQKDISQVERQMREWNRRHLGEQSARERELSLLQTAYEKAQRTNTSKLQDIKNFILGKPKKKDSLSGRSAAAVSYTRPTRVGKSESDANKRLSKISFTSTSSNVSDSSEVFPTLTFYNPGYGQYQTKIPESPEPLKTAGASPPRLKPPPLPPQAACKLTKQKAVCVDSLLFGVQDNDLSRLPGTSLEVPLSPSKPSPPPKPANLLKKVNSVPEGEESSKDERPASPDYITPNVARQYTAQYRKRLLAANHLRAHLAPPSLAPLRTRVVGSKGDDGSLTLQCPDSSHGPAPALGVRPRDENRHQKKTLLQFANQLMKAGPKRSKEESMFYVASKRWSSFPDLRKSRLSGQPIYIELLGPPDRRSKSMSGNGSSE